MKKIIDKIKVFLLKKELQSIAEYKLLLNLQSKILDKQDEEFLEALSNYKKEREEFQKTKQQEITKIIENYDEKYQKEFNNNKKKIQDLLNFKLLPWNKVWVLREFDNKIEEITIESITIFKDNKIEIRNENNFYWEFFSTEKECIEEYNKMIENLKK